MSDGSPRRRFGLPPPEVLFAFAALGLVLLFGSLFNANGVFFQPAVHADALWQIAGFGILACGLTIVILAGGIDLSVGSVVALSGVIFTIASIREELPPVVSFGLAIAAGTGCGFLNGVMVAHLRLQPFIATLAMMAFARGLAKSSLLSGGVKIQRMPPPSEIEILNAKLDLAGLHVSLGTCIFLACFLATFVALRHFRFGRHVYAIGDNAQAAWLSGVPVKRTVVWAYTACGLLAGIAGVLFAGLERQGNPDGGAGYELTAIAMVVVGGTSLSGGRGGVTLTLLGALTIGYVRKILDLNGIATPAQHMITGGIIVVAVLVPKLLSRGLLHRDPGRP
ncbi:MAG: ABC transporter permease [Phycisphaerae bacterium]|jgi:ribose transport system permease protein|nr:ABC transporter permease [Phycisphaerae bacterium]